MQTVLQIIGTLIGILVALGIWKAYELLVPNKPDKEWRFYRKSSLSSDFIDRTAPDLEQALHSALTSPLVKNLSSIKSVHYLRGTEWIEVPESVWNPIGVIAEIHNS